MAEASRKFAPAAETFYLRRAEAVTTLIDHAEAPVAPAELMVDVEPDGGTKERP